MNGRRPPCFGTFALRSLAIWEVHIDPALGLLRIQRVVPAVDGGRILNRNLAQSQVAGGVMGIGMTIFEETECDPTGRIANATYLIPVNALDLSGFHCLRTLGAEAACRLSLYGGPTLV